MIAKATAVSAAATPMENNVKKKPSNCPEEDAVEHSEVEIGCIQHQLDGDEHGNEVTTSNKAIYSDEEQEC